MRISWVATICPHYGKPFASFRGHDVGRYRHHRRRTGCDDSCRLTESVRSSRSIEGTQAIDAAHRSRRDLFLLVSRHGAAALVNWISSAARNSPSRGPLNLMAAIAGAFTVSSKNGTGSAGALRPGAAAIEALSTTC